MSAAIGLYLMIADGELGPEIFSVATKKDKAKIIWLEAKRMIKKSPALNKRLKTLVGEINSELNDSIFKPLGRDSDTLDGLNVHGALFDEVHAWKDMNLYDVVVDGTSSREQPLIFVTSTAGTVRESVFDRLYEESELVINGYVDKDGYKDERLLPIIYELDKREEWTDKKAWVKANPGLGTIKRIDNLESKVNKAKANPMLVKKLVCKDFNIRERVGDLSSTTDLTCATLIFQVTNDEHIYVEQMYWLPEDLLEKRRLEDKIPYDIWRDNGLLRTTPGNKVHYKFVVDWYLEMQNEKDIYLFKVGYDGWSANYFVEDMKATFGEGTMERVIQGKKTLSSPMKSLGADLQSKRIIYNNNPILKWNLTNVAVDVDKNNNIQPMKTSNQRKRIDGFASLLDAYVCYERNLENYKNMI